MTTLSTPSLQAASAMAGPDPQPSRAGRAPAADMTLEEKVAQLGSRWVGQRHAGSTTPPSEPRRTRRRPSTSRRCRTFSRLRVTVTLEEASVHGLGQLTRVFGSFPVTAAEGAAELVRQQQRGAGGLATRHSRARPRGVPHRVHHLRRDRVPGGHRMGRHLRPRPGRADGRRDRSGYGRSRRAPRSFARPGRRTRLPLGAGRGDPRRGSLPGLDAGHRLRPWPAERRRDRHPEAFRRVLGLASGAQPRPGVDGAARAARRHPAAVRDGAVTLGRRGLGDELLLRHRRRARRRGPLAADRSAARRMGFHRHGRLRLLGDPVPGHHAPTVAADFDEAGVLALARRHRCRTARTPSGSDSTWSTGCAAASSPKTLIDRAAGRLLSRRCSSACWIRTGRRRVRSWTRRTDLDSAAEPRTRPGNRRDAPSSCSTPALRCRCWATDAPRSAAWPSSVRARTTHVPSWVATHFPTTSCRATRISASAWRCRRRSTPLRAELPGVEVVYAQGCTVQGDDRSGFAAAVGGCRGGRRLRRVRRRPGRPVRARHVRRGMRRARTCGCPACRPT